MCFIQFWLRDGIDGINWSSRLFWPQIQNLLHTWAIPKQNSECFTGVSLHRPSRWHSWPGIVTALGLQSQQPCIVWFFGFPIVKVLLLAIVLTWPRVNVPWVPWSMRLGSAVEAAPAASMLGHIVPEGNHNAHLPWLGSSVQWWGSLLLLFPSQALPLAGILGAPPALYPKHAPAS